MLGQPHLICGNGNHQIANPSWYNFSLHFEALHRSSLILQKSLALSLKLLTQVYSRVSTKLHNSSPTGYPAEGAYPVRPALLTHSKVGCCLSPNTLFFSDSSCQLIYCLDVYLFNLSSPTDSANPMRKNIHV